MERGFAGCLKRVLLALSLVASAASVAQTDPAPTPPGSSSEADAKTLPEVTVEAQRKALEHSLRGFVGKITRSTRFSGESLARWREPLCFVIAGLSRPKAEFVLSRLSKISTSAGAQVSRRGCSQRNGNFYVIFTPDPSLTLKYLNHSPGLLFGKDANSTQRHEFMNPSKARVVRVWHNGKWLGQYGTSLTEGGVCGAALPGTQVNCEYNGGSRITEEAVHSLTQTLIVIDTRLANGFTFEQLADYIAMAGLVDLDLNTDLGDTPTILRLFTEPEQTRPQELTPWDTAFLSETYHTDPAAFNQRAQIATRMVGDVLK